MGISLFNQASTWFLIGWMFFPGLFVIEWTFFAENPKSILYSLKVK